MQAFFVEPVKPKKQTLKSYFKSTPPTFLAIFSNVPVESDG